MAMRTYEVETPILPILAKVLEILCGRSKESLKIRKLLEIFVFCNVGQHSDNAFSFTVITSEPIALGTCSSYRDAS
jgi:hypothetical protein